MHFDITRCLPLGCLAWCCATVVACARPAPRADDQSAVDVPPPLVRQPVEQEAAADRARSITLYYPRNEDVSSGCTATGTVRRPLWAHADPLQFTLQSLLDGPSEEEQAVGGVFSPFDESPSSPAAMDLGAHLLGVTVYRGMATVDFARAAEMFFLQAACPSAMVTTSIEQTLQQFDEVREVRFAIEGQPITQWEGEVGPRG